MGHRFSFNSIISRLTLALFIHYRTLFYDMDTVKDVALYRLNRRDLLQKSLPRSPEPKEPRTINSQYLFPYCIILYTFFDCAYVFYQNGFRYVINGMPRMFFHLVWPKEFWEFSDIMMAFAIGMCLIMWPCLLTDSMLEEKYQMYLIVDKRCNKAEIIANGGVLHPIEAQKIYHYRKRFRSVMPIMMINIYLLIETFFFYYFYHNWQGSVHDLIMLLCIILFFFYLCISNLFLLYYFSLAIAYIKIKQNLAFAQLQQLSGIISTLQKTSSPTKRLEMNANLWLQSRRINRKMLQIFEEIKGQNHFWSRYLTIYFLVYIIEIVYLLYVFLFCAPELLLQRWFCFLIAIDFFIVIIYITLECSLIVHKNSLMHRTTQRIGLHLQVVYHFRIGELLKLDGMAMNYRNIPGISFKLLNSWRINSTFFQMIFSYISIFFMMIVQKQQKNLVV